MEKCKTLGGRSFFYYIINEKERVLIIQTSKSPTEHTISFGDAPINDVWARINSAENDKEKHQTSFYGQPKWGKCPNRILCPYIAKLLLDVFNEEQIKQVISK